MKLAMIFPGQGSQSVGMGRELADQFAEAKAVFDEVDEALGEKLSTVIFEGTQEELTLTTNAQPALMAVSMAALKALETRGFSLENQVAYVAGHSLGEYSALCAAGAFSLSDTAKLLRIRGNAMQAAVPVGQGAMAAIIGLEREQVEAVCHQSAGDNCCQIANDNGGGQLVISGGCAIIPTRKSRWWKQRYWRSSKSWEAIMSSLQSLGVCWTSSRQLAGNEISRIRSPRWKRCSRGVRTIWANCGPQLRSS